MGGLRFTPGPKPPNVHSAVTRLLFALTLCALPACQSNCYYDGPVPGSQFTAVAGETATGDASWTQTPFSFAIRYHGLDVGGAPRTGFVSAFGSQRPGSEGFNWAGQGDWPVRGQVVALQGYFAEQHPEWLCQTLTMVRVAAPDSGGAAQVVCPSVGDDPERTDCDEASFITVTTNVFEYEEIFNEDVPDPDLFVTSDACEVADGAQ